MEQIMEIPLNLIEGNPENPRKKISETELNELAASIGAVGLLQPITVRLIKGVQGKYQIVCGHRRYEAAKLAGLVEAPCIVRKLTDEQAYEIMVTENLQRKDIDPFEESAAFCAMMKKGYDTESLAAKFGKSKTYILSRIKLQNLIEPFRKLYENGEVDFSHCSIISRCDTSLQQRLFNSRYSKDDYYSLKGKTTDDVKSALKSMGRMLCDAVFDTTACKECTCNSACWDLFTDKHGMCENESCFIRKSIDAKVAIFEKVRQANPGFHIIDDHNIPKEGEGASLLDELKRRGFPLKKEDPNEYESVERPGLWNVDPECEINAFSFGWKGWCGKKREKAENSGTANKWKADWELNRMARDRDGQIESIKSVVLRENIQSLLPEMAEELDTPRKMMIMNYLLEVLQASVSDVSIFGLTSDMGKEEARIHIRTRMRGVEKWMALLAFIMNWDDGDSETDLECFRDYLPEAFKGIDDAAKRRFYDHARDQWHGYEEVTDEMIDEDLKNRMES